MWKAALPQAEGAPPFGDVRCTPRRPFPFPSPLPQTGCLLVNVPRELFMEFVHMHPRALLLYLQQVRKARDAALHLPEIRAGGFLVLGVCV